MPHPPEFSRPIPLEGVMPGRERIEKVEATEDECRALAGRFDLRALGGLKARMTVLRVSEGDVIRVTGDIEADVVQACVVSLQDVPAQVRAHFDACFTEDGEIFGEETDASIEMEEDPHEVLLDGMIDLGELVAQYLSLELEPYPRAPGVSLAAQLAEVGGGDAGNRPFQLLRGLKKPEKEE